MEVMLLSDLEKGMKFPEYDYTLTKDIIDKYLEGVEEGDPLYTNEDYAKRSGFGHLIVPPTTIALYVTPSRVFKTINKKPPSGLLQAGQRFEFCGPVRVNETVNVKTFIEDVYKKKSRDFVVLKGEAFDSNGNLASSSSLTFIWPSQK